MSNKQTTELLERSLDTLIWVTGSEDFARDGSGKASVGANKLLYPLIDDLNATLENIRGVVYERVEIAFEGE